MTAAIYFHPDSYLITRDKLMGRHAAGAGFLRGFAATESGSEVWALLASSRHRAGMEAVLREAGYRGKVHGLGPDELHRLGEAGCLYLPGPGLDEAAWRRLAVGERGYSLCGVTHTTASHTAMAAITALLAAPVRDWDALVCTSSAVRDSVRKLLEAQGDYLKWRLGATRFELPQLPLIPLGVSCEDFDFSVEEKAQVRRDLGIAAEDVVILFVGRLSFHAKAHPLPMYLALERLAQNLPGRQVHLVQCGWFNNDAIRSAFIEGEQMLCPSVRQHKLDGREAHQRRQAWVCADIFMSLSDNIQETFGLTPIEAMAAGLPVVVSDWDGYRDTVRHGVDGFRVPTLMPGASAGADLARRYDDGTDTYDLYCGHTCELIAVDVDAAAEALSRLARDAELRRTMGEAGRQRVRGCYDWTVVLNRYRELWADLAERRRAGPDFFGPPPIQVRPDRMDPFVLFDGYPTAILDDANCLELVPGTGAEVLQERRAMAMNRFAEYLYPSAEECRAVIAQVQRQPGITVAALLEVIPAERRDPVRRALVWMAKMHVLRVISHSS